MKSRTVRVGALWVLVLAGIIAVPGVAEATTPAPVTPDQAFVVAISHDFLGRSPTSVELVTDTSQLLDDATVRSTIIHELATSPEYVSTTVASLYQQALGRAGDPAGIEYWAGRVESGAMTIAQVAAALYASREYFDDFSSSDTRTWVLNLYQGLLGRDGTFDPAGVMYWSRLAGKFGRYWVAGLIYQSVESRHARVGRLYDELLGREPDAAGWDYWARVILKRGDLALATMLASSDEYYARAFARYQAGTVPTAPTGVTAVAGKAAATVSWSAPSWEGGSAISGYTVTALPGGGTCQSTGALQCTFTGLMNDVAYTFRVTATNDIGTSIASDWSSPVTPTLLGWSPPTQALPTTGTFLYLQSDPGDWVGAGRTYTYTKANSAISVDATGSQVHLNIQGDEDWNLIGSGPSSGPSITTGYWQNLNRSQFDFYGDGRGCNTDSTDLQIDQVSYGSSGELDHLVLRFLQHCEGGTPALRGELRYDANDPTAPPPPGNPADFAWQPPTGSVPAHGNFLYLQGAPGDFISGGQTILLDSSKGDQFTLSNTYGRANDVSLSTGAPYWDVWLFGMSSQSRLTTGLYTNVERAPFNNPVTGGFSVSGDGRGCNESVSTFAVDSISYDTSGNVSSIAARFVQHCESSSAPPLYGALRFG